MKYTTYFELAYHQSSDYKGIEITTIVRRRTYVIYKVNLKQPGKASVLDNIFFTYNIEMFIWYCKDDVHLFVYRKDNYINPRLSNISRVEDNALYIHTNQFKLRTKNA